MVLALLHRQTVCLCKPKDYLTEPVKPLSHSRAAQRGAGYSLWCGSVLGMT